MKKNKGSIQVEYIAIIVGIVVVVGGSLIALGGGIKTSVNTTGNLIDNLQTNGADEGNQYGGQNNVYESAYNGVQPGAGGNSGIKYNTTLKNTSGSDITGYYGTSLTPFTIESGETKDFELPSGTPFKINFPNEETKEKFLHDNSDLSGYTEDDTSINFIIKNNKTLNINSLNGQNPYAAKVASVQKLYDVGEANLTNDDIVTINGIDCYVLQVDGNKAELITKGIYNVRFDEGEHTSGDVMNYVGDNSYSDKTYRYDYSTLKTWMDNFYTDYLNGDSNILESNVVSYYNGNYSYGDDLTIYSTASLTQHVFALDAKEAKANVSKFRNYYVLGFVDVPNSHVDAFWTSAGDLINGCPRASYACEDGFFSQVVNSNNYGARPAFWITLD